jgi:hypothetical protein
MWETVERQWPAKIVLGFFIFFTVWWIILRLMNLPSESSYNQYFTTTYGLIALLGGALGIVVSRQWGGLHSIMGKSIGLFALGLLFQEIGQIAYSYYIYFLNVAVPYPSIGDFFFYGTIPLYIAAVIYLARASGIHISLRSMKSKLQGVLIPVGILLFSYFVLLQGYKADWSNPLKVFIDFVVPFGQAIYISLALLTFTLTRGILGGIMKNKILFILFALLAQYIADWTFIYQANRDIWYPGGVNDYMFLCAYVLMALGLLQLKTVYQDSKK